MTSPAATPRVLVINGGSSSGKSSVARALQAMLPAVWLRLGVDTLIEAAPPALFDRGGLEVRADGDVRVGSDFAAVEDWWMAGVARMAEVGGRVLVEDNFLSGPSAQQRWRAALAAVPVGWIGVHCDPAVAALREQERGDRVTGMAARQAVAVHSGIDYDLDVDTSTESPEAAARRIHQHFFGGREGAR